MNKFINHILILSFFILLTINAKSQSENEHCTQIKTLVTMLNNNHYEPVTIDYDVANSIFKNYIESLDPYSFYFIEEDINLFSEKLVNNSNNYTDAFCEILSLSTDIYKKRLQESDELLTELSEIPFDFEVIDTMYFSSKDTFLFPKNKEKRKQRWTKIISYKICLNFFYDLSDTTTIDESVDDLMKNEPEYRQNTILNEQCQIKKLLSKDNDFENFVAIQFLNAITSNYDPHSMFFSLDMKEAFESEISTTTYSFGIFLEESDGDIYIAKLIPGSPAWTSNELNEGDIIKKIQPQGEEPIEITCMDVYEMEAILNSAEISKMDITVKKTNGLIKTIMLVKAEIQTDKNKITSYILNGEKKIGYIYLPAFYSGFENESEGCANDIAKEIIKLKKENIQGLIFDVRDNGGGSVTEALNLAGIFINVGPLAISKYTNTEPTTIKDMNRGTIYNGPLVLMVNNFSASASELLAAILQDYNRAIIVGGTTFGKGSAQIILPLDSIITMDNFATNFNENSSSFVKVTVGKMYRLDGSTYQNSGVSPDINLPNLLEFYSYREEDLPAALKSDSIIKKIRFSPLPLLPIKSLLEKSQIRINESANFKDIKELNDQAISLIINQEFIPLEPTAFAESMSLQMDIMTELENAGKRETNLFKVENNEYFKLVIEVDSYQKEINSNVIQNIEKDIYIEEVYQIINNYINLINK